MNALLLCSCAAPATQVGKEGKRLRPTILLLMASALTSIVPSSAFLVVDERPASTHVTEVCTVSFVVMGSTSDSRGVAVCCRSM